MRAIDDIGDRANSRPFACQANLQDLLDVDGRDELSFAQIRERLFASRPGDSKGDSGAGSAAIQP